MKHNNCMNALEMYATYHGRNSSDLIIIKNDSNHNFIKMFMKHRKYTSYLIHHILKGVTQEIKLIKVHVVIWIPCYRLQFRSVHIPPNAKSEKLDTFLSRFLSPKSKYVEHNFSLYSIYCIFVVVGTYSIRHNIMT